MGTKVNHSNCSTGRAGLPCRNAMLAYTLKLYVLNLVLRRGLQSDQNRQGGRDSFQSRQGSTAMQSLNNSYSRFRQPLCGVRRKEPGLLQ